MLVVREDGKCCPLGCVAVMSEHPQKQCETKVTTTLAPAVVSGASCTTQSSMCPMPRCMEYAGCTIDPNPPLVYDEDGECCPAHLCTYIQDSSSADTCQHVTASDSSGARVESTTKATSTVSVATTNPDMGSGEDTTVIPTDKLNETDINANANHSGEQSKSNTRTIVVTVFVVLLTLVVVLAVAWFVIERRRDGQGYVAPTFACTLKHRERELTTEAMVVEYEKKWHERWDAEHHCCTVVESWCL